MKNKNNVYVQVESKEQAETYRKVLEAMGEPISFDYYPYDQRTKKLTFSDGWYLSREEWKSRSCITFGELIDLLQRKPLYTSTDGLSVFEYDLVWIPQMKKEGGYYDNPLQFNARNTWAKNEIMFVNKQAALEWIESQKPKKKVIEIGKGLVFIVTKDSVKIDYQLKGGCAIEISNEKIKEVAKALEDLQNG